MKRIFLKYNEKPPTDFTGIARYKDIVVHYLKGRLHREIDPAVEWSDGYRAWYYHGAKLKEVKDGREVVFGLANTDEGADSYKIYLKSLSLESLLYALEELPYVDDLILEELVSRNFYPEPTPFMVKENLSLAEMVRYYGPDWHIYRDPHQCPNCNANLDNLEEGPPFCRVIVVVRRDEDEAKKYQCPDCDHVWLRDVYLDPSKSR